MKEEDYVLVTNKTKISSARKILSDVLPGDEYGIDEKEFRRVVSFLYSTEEKLLQACDLRLKP